MRSLRLNLFVAATLSALPSVAGLEARERALPALLPPGALDAQERALALGPATWSLTEPLSRIAGLGRLRDGRLLISDSREAQLYLASSDGRTLTPFGSQGEGPREYRRPFAIVRGLADSLYVYSSGNRRFFRVDAHGAVADGLPFPPSLLRGGGLAPPRGADSRGRLYWSGDVVGQTSAGFKRNEVQNIRRWTPGAGRIDTVAPRRDHAAEMHEKRFFPFAESDAYVVAPDGRIGVLSAREYRLRWYRDGRVIAEGPALTHEPVRIDAAERAAFRRERAGQAAGNATAIGVSPSRGEGPSPEAIRRAAEAWTDDLFPPVKPPFVEDGALISPAEDVWVVRSGPHGERRARVDVLSTSGARRGHLLLPDGRRLVALAPEGIYLARVDEDGLEWLERYAWPEGLR